MDRYRDSFIASDILYDLINLGLNLSKQAGRWAGRLLEGHTGVGESDVASSS